MTTTRINSVSVVPNIDVDSPHNNKIDSKLTLHITMTMNMINAISVSVVPPFQHILTVFIAVTINRIYFVSVVDYTYNNKIVTQLWFLYNIICCIAPLPTQTDSLYKYDNELDKHCLTL